MRLLHTSDWHLGRLFHGVHLTEDQAHLLDQFILLVKDSRPDAVIVAGDVYDRSVPPTDAVRLLDQTLSELVLGLKISTLVIAGNHDSPDRLGFGSDILADRGLYVRGRPGRPEAPVALADESGPVFFLPLPYAEPAAVREALGDPGARDQNSALAARIEAVNHIFPDGVRRVAVGHVFVAGGKESDSERPLSVGGVATVEASVFEPFHFTCLGHLHRAQSVLGGKVAYSGSPLKYSFSEINDRKSVSLVEIDASGRASVDRIELTPRRDLRLLEGRLDDLLQGPGPGENREDYLLVVLKDKGALLDAMGRLREVYPNVLHLKRPALTGTADQTSSARNQMRMTDTELFGSFFEQVAGEPLSEAEEASFNQILEELRRKEREARG